uniref:Uncharacterized protein n=1 Tax=Anguilla anguilla TaxID=7936 RepID=A0A0E9S3L9_ANGAN
MKINLFCGCRFLKIAVEIKHCE